MSERKKKRVLPDTTISDFRHRLEACEQAVLDQQRIREAAAQYIVAKRAYDLARQRFNDAAARMDETVLSVVNGVAPRQWTLPLSSGTSTAGS